MNKQDLENFNKRLQEEKIRLEKELSGVGEKNPNNPNDWQAVTKDLEIDSADENEVADKFEEMEENTGIIRQLENQLIEVNAAIQRIENGTYGKCEVCGEMIEKERLEANPSSRISIKHKHNK